MSRVTERECEHVAAILRRHFDDGRLETDEFADRLERALTARSREDLDAVLHDLPLLPPAVAATRRSNRHGEGAEPHAGWRPTHERFRDPSTSRVMRVWVDIADGTRHYVADT